MRAAAVLSIGEIAARLGVPVWCVRRAITRGFLSEPARVGVARVWRASDLPAITSALRRAGYLPTSKPVAAGVCP